MLLLICAGIPRFYQGLIPWAWIEASTKGAVLLFTAAEIETVAVSNGISPAVAGLLGGMGGGISQAYATMGKADHSPLRTRRKQKNSTCRLVHVLIQAAFFFFQFSGFCTCMKTAEITRHKQASAGIKPPSVTDYLAPTIFLPRCSRSLVYS
jgi:hypothetical protein